MSIKPRSQTSVSFISMRRESEGDADLPVSSDRTQEWFKAVLGKVQT